jgi:hypothetical protein
VIMICFLGVSPAHLSALSDRACFIHIASHVQHRAWASHKGYKCDLWTLSFLMYPSVWWSFQQFSWYKPHLPLNYRFLFRKLTHWGGTQRSTSMYTVSLTRDIFPWLIQCIHLLIHACK